MKLRHSLTFRLGLLYAVLFAASVAVLTGVQYWISVRIPLERAKILVRRDAAELADIYILDGRDALIARLQRRAAQGDRRKAFHAFILPDGRIASANLPSWPREHFDGWKRMEADDYRDGVEVDRESLTLDRGFDDGARLLVGRDIDDIDDREETLNVSAAWIIGATLLLGVITGALMSRVIGRRIEAVTIAARRVIDGDLSGRVPLEGSGDDFDNLGATLNLMLERIQALVESVRRVSDNVAHELRTPLARLRGELEQLALAEPEGEGAHRFEIAISEAERLEKTFDAVLRIARIESRRHAANFAPVDLGPLLADAGELYELAAAARHQSLDTRIEPDLVCAGDRDLLFQAICNLLDNAVKYAPVGGRVRLDAVRRGTTIVIAVADDGPGIAEEHVGQVTERFYRIDHTAAAPGAGLGLSMVAAVADLHGSRLVFEPGRPGLVVRWILPAESPTEAT